MLVESVDSALLRGIEFLKFSYRPTRRKKKTYKQLPTIQLGKPARVFYVIKDGVKHERTISNLQ